MWGGGLTVRYFAGGLNPDHPAKSRIVGVDDLHARLISAAFCRDLYDYQMSGMALRATCLLL